MRRPPESVALTAAQASAGVVELEQPGQGEMMLPFEGLGVDTTWEFRMPRLANPIDYRSIADVLVTIEYSALDSPIHRQQVIRDLDPTVVAERAFSLRQLPDQWYDLHNTGGTEVRAVAWRTERTDFPANLSDLTISNVALYVVRRPSEEFEVPLEHLLFTEDGTTGPVGGPPVSVDGLISARQGNAPALTELIGGSPVGGWELALRSAEVGERLREGSVEDILLVMSYAGQLPHWPD